MKEEEKLFIAAVCKQEGLSPADFEAKRLEKNVVCPKCNALMVFKVMLASEGCQLKQVKYKLRCENCKKVFETDWRNFK